MFVRDHTEGRLDRGDLLEGSFQVKNLMMRTTNASILKGRVDNINEQSAQVRKQRVVTDYTHAFIIMFAFLFLNN